MNVYTMLGLEKLVEDVNILESLKKHILRNVRYTIPGYKYDYKLCSFRDYIEFTYCHCADGKPLGIDMHFSANHHLKLKFYKAVDTSATAHIYEMTSTTKSSPFPVRVVCPDVLPSLVAGDVVYGQVVAFADESTVQILKNDCSKAVSVFDNHTVLIKGEIIDTSYRNFKFNTLECAFWEIDVQTDIGTITMLIKGSVFDEEPNLGEHIEARCILSMDVAIEHKQLGDQPFYHDIYTDIIPDAKIHRYRNGFVPNFRNNQQVLMKSILENDYTRFSRCCNDIVAIERNDENSQFKKHACIVELSQYIGIDVEKVEITHILKSMYNSYLGYEGLAVYASEGLKCIVFIHIDDCGLVDKVSFLNPDRCEIGVDYEFHLLSMLGTCMCGENANRLREYLSENCMYRSEYSGKSIVGTHRIIEHNSNVSNKLDDTNQYSFTMAQSDDELYIKEDLPKAYRGKWCFRMYQLCEGKEELAAIVFIMLNEHNKIVNILLSRNGQYLKSFKEKSKAKGIENRDYSSVQRIITYVYGNEKPIFEMRKGSIPDNDEFDVYVWKEADKYATNWLSNKGYRLQCSELQEDCIGYSCVRNGIPYAIFFYAYGRQKTAMLDGDYCTKLRNLEMSKDRTILVIYLHIDKKDGDDGKPEYTVSSYNNTESDAEPWLLTTVMEKNIFLFYPRKEMVDLCTRLIAAYNTQNLDILKAICGKDACLDVFEHDGLSLNDGLYSHLSSIHKEHGNMKLAYIRFNDVVYSAVPYLDNYSYISFSVNQENKLHCITFHPLDEHYRELLITDDMVEYCSIDDVPSLKKVDFLPPSEISRFSIRLTFDNGEIKRYHLDGDFGTDEVTEYQDLTFTDRMFTNGRITESIPLPDWMGYRNYPRRGQGVEFVNGAAISTVELYHNSYPIEKFSYVHMEDVHVSQFDYDDDGFGVGYISNLDPKNPHYLLDKNTMTATTIPEEYQNTPIAVYPFYGGYSEGLVMVSTLGQIDLQYHHNRSGCAGMWGWLDHELNVAIEPKYVYAMNFIDGRAIVCKGTWDVQYVCDRNKYWCNNEQWGVIDKSENEIVPCRFDELYEVDDTDRLYFIHEGGWDKGYYGIYDVQTQSVILKLDFDFDIGYMFNECFVIHDHILMFTEHLAGEGKDLIYAYDLNDKKYLVYKDEYTERTFNGEKKVVVNKDGRDIIVF